MNNRWMGSLVAVAAILAISAVLLAQTPARPAAPRAQAVTARTPDFSGIWVGSRDGAVFPREAPAMTPPTEETFNYRKNLRGGTRAELDPEVLCEPVGLTWLLVNSSQGAGSYVEIIQSPSRVLMLFEYDHWIRQIWTDGREHPEDLDLSWMGHSIGKWDGDTLVVDTVGIHSETWLTPTGHPHTDSLHVVERIRRADLNTLTVDITFEDPKMYTKPWGGRLVFKTKQGAELEERVNCEDRWLFKTRSY
jgi:hypothetical protein